MEGKSMESIKQGMLLCMMTFAFWGILYPQFSLVEESYETIYESKNPKEDFFEILNAKKGEVVIKSKFLELLKQRQESKK